MPVINKIQKVDLRNIWKNEAADFTKWLANNIDYLNEIIDLDISVQAVEENVGPYRVDIYGEDGFGNKVIIENQLEKTDHTHLGQIITYLVNLDANIAIWVTAKPTEEHRQVVEWLNETTPDNMYFYLVKVEGIKIEGQESVAPLFTVVERPTVEMKKVGAEKKDSARRFTVRREFWTKLIEAMNKNNRLCQNLNPTNDAWLGIALGYSGVSLNLVATSTYARSEIYINKGEVTKNKEIFDFFVKSKEDIELKFGKPLIWERMEDRVTSRIKAELTGVDIFNESDWPKMISFLIESSSRMHDVFKEYVQKLKREVTSN
ncbi:DUF4268 domain-containing protein [Patescibacteria group bacterium]|nr:DUF4268 domain-containing protein [Patescibacteria group bacterium]